MPAFNPTVTGTTFQERRCSEPTPPSTGILVLEVTGPVFRLSPRTRTSADIRRQTATWRTGP